MDILYAMGGASVMEVRNQLPDPPTDMAVRRLIHILEEKGHVRRQRRGRKYVYSPRQCKKRAGARALQHVLDTFFEGAVDEALASHLTKRESSVSEEQLERMIQLIERARRRGR
jgi:predicted transcriptional regulator